MIQGSLNFGYPALSLVGAPVDVRAARVIVSTSSGKDSSAASMLLADNGIEHDRVFMDTGWEHPLTYQYLRGPLAEALGPIEEIRGELDFLALVRKKGMFPSRVARFCTEQLKVIPILEHISKLAATETREIVNVVGIRRAESKARSEMPEWEWSESFDCWFWRPLVEWHTADVVAIHDAHQLALNPLYYLGFKRVGCFPCIHARKEEIDLISRLMPERIELIDEAEIELTAAAARKFEGEELKHYRSMFSYHGGDDKHFALPIRDAVEWARSKRGEWQPTGGDGCARFGLCSSWAEDEEDEDEKQYQRVFVLEAPR